jgi:hypothetical protein
MLHAALAFGQQVGDRLKHQQSGDGATWLERLWKLPDPRMEGR